MFNDHTWRRRRAVSRVRSISFGQNLILKVVSVVGSISHILRTHPEFDPTTIGSEFNHQWLLQMETLQATKKVVTADLPEVWNSHLTILLSVENSFKAPSQNFRLNKVSGVDNVVGKLNAGKYWS